MVSLSWQNNLQEENITCISNALARGEVCLLPTETVYGLFAREDSSTAVEEIYRLKHRDPNKRLQTFISSISDTQKLNIDLGPIAKRMLERLFPGPITLVLFDRDGRSHGLRMPSDPFLNKLTKACPFPIVATSANLSGEPAAITAEQALKSLDGQPQLSLDAGESPAKLSSTVIAFDSPKHDNWKILRHGPVSLEDIQLALEDH